jgi:hypothetical protein
VLTFSASIKWHEGVMAISVFASKLLLSGWEQGKVFLVKVKLVTLPP